MTSANALVLGDGRSGLLPRPICGKHFTKRGFGLILLPSRVHARPKLRKRKPLGALAATISMNVTLRFSTVDDIDFLFRLHRTAMQTYVTQTWGAWDEGWQLQHFQQHFDPDHCQIIVLQRQDIGVISVVRQVTGMFLNNIELLPAYQRQGIGTYLIKTLLDEARQKGVVLTLQVLKVNPASRLYERLGFVMSGETVTHYQMSAMPSAAG
jgi:ribosomal protein S18 acetylase RimI-like enzyme